MRSWKERGREKEEEKIHHKRLLGVLIQCCQTKLRMNTYPDDALDIQNLNEIGSRKIHERERERELDKQ